MLATETIAKFVITPKGSDIAKLLLLCAPSEILDQMGLSDSSAIEFSTSLDLPTKKAQHERVETFALALYYASRSSASHRKSRSITQRLYIAPEVLLSLVTLTSLEEQSQLQRLFSKLGGAGKKKVDHASAAKPEIKAEWASLRKQGVVYGDRKKFIKNASAKYRVPEGSISNWIQAWNKEFCNSK